MGRQLPDSMMARVTDNGTVSKACAVTNRVKQGCVLTPTLFSLKFSAMLMDAYRGERSGIRVAYRMDGQLFNHRRMHFQSRVFTTTVYELFVDDCALNNTTDGGMQRNMDPLRRRLRRRPGHQHRRQWLCTYRYPALPTMYPKSA
nr:unnamed protein product [Spirometra erinaceieuropaei]